MGTRYGGRRGRAVRNRGGAADLRKNEREAREYRDGTGRRSCREREVRVWGTRRAHVARRHIARGAEQKKEENNALSQTDTGARTSDPAQTNFFPTPY
jgi:hypothetical protein